MNLPAAEELTDPAALLQPFLRLSASIVLSCKKAGEGLYPAIDSVGSKLKMLMGKRHYCIAHEISRSLTSHEGLK